MSGKKGEKNEQASANMAEKEDFETYVRGCLGALCKDVESLKNGQAKLQQDLNLLKDKVTNNEKSLSSLTKISESLSLKFEKLNGEVHEACCKIESIERRVKDHDIGIKEMYEKLLSLERYSRDYNLRIYNLPESPREDCIEKLQTVFKEDVNLETKIENAHRIGGTRSDGSPRPRTPLYNKEEEELEKRCMDIGRFDLRGSSKEEAVEGNNETGLRRREKTSFPSWKSLYRWCSL